MNYKNIKYNPLGIVRKSFCLKFALMLMLTLFFSSLASFMVLNFYSWSLFSVFISLLIGLAFFPLSHSLSIFILGAFEKIKSGYNNQKKENDQIKGKIANKTIGDFKPKTQMAILIPCYQEDLTEVLLRVKVMQQSIRNACDKKSFCFEKQYKIFISSDTQDFERIKLEQKIISDWLADKNNSSPDLPQIVYSSRFNNYLRKVGNIKVWLEQWASVYDFVTILDADSIVTGKWIVRAHQKLENDSKLALLQAMLVCAGRGSLFARFSQFSSNLCGSIWAQGSCFWTGDNANYWGHNAAIRTQALIQDACLPVFKDNTTYLSHDIVEAAFLCSKGWKVQLDPTTEDSWEETPSDPITEASRQLRWCQGNMQHWKMLIDKNITLQSKFHLFNGIIGYLAAPLLFLSLMLSKVYTSINLQITAIDLCSLYVSLLLYMIVLSTLPYVFGLFDHLSSKSSHHFGGKIWMFTSALSCVVLSVVRIPSSIIGGSSLIAHLLFYKMIKNPPKWNAQNRSGEFYSIKQSLCDNFIITLLTCIFVKFLGFDWSVCLAVLFVCVVCAIIDSLMSKPASTIGSNRLWNTRECSNPLEPFASYIFSRDKVTLTHKLKHQALSDDNMIESQNLIDLSVASETAT